MNMRITKEYRPLEGINSRSENRPDITNQKAIELKESVLKNLSLFKTDQQQIEYLKEYVSFKNDEHDISFYLAQHIHETNLFWNENCSDINTLDNGRYTQSFRQIQSEIHNKGCLDVYLDWQGHLITNTKKLRNGNILLLHELAQVYKFIKKSNIQESEKPQVKENLWLINKEQKEKILTALNNKKILKYSGKGKPSGSIKNLILIFKSLHDLKMIDEDLIIKQTDVKDEVWKKDFIESEFIMNGNKPFKKTTIRDGKRDYYTKFKSSEILDKQIEEIKSIIQSALTT